MADLRPPKRNWRQLILGEPATRRRMVWTGVAAGLVIAIAAALIAAAFGGSGGGALDHKAEPTAAVSDGGGEPDGGGQVDQPTEAPIEDTPTAAATSETTEEPIATEPSPTEPPVEATPTQLPVEEPTDAPTVVGGA